jgi:hypothetical protein
LRLGDWSFANCPVLGSLTLPASTQFVDGSVFSGTSNVSLAVSADNCHFRRWSLFLLAFDGHSIVRYCGLGRVAHIPTFMQTLGPNCFRACGFVERVVFDIGSNVRLIDSGAFWECDSLSQICIPSSVEVLGRSCFWHCGELRVVTFQRDSKLKELRRHAFAFCISLLAIWIPASVEVIGESCFRCCSSLGDVTFAPGSRLARIEESVFFRCSSLRSICIPESVQVLSAFSFTECFAVQHFTFEPGCRAKRPFQWMYTCRLVRPVLFAIFPDEAPFVAFVGFPLLIGTIALICFVLLSG